MRPYKYAKKRALIVTRYIDWEWHFRRDGTMWIRNLATGRVIEIGRIE